MFNPTLPPWAGNDTKSISNQKSPLLYEFTQPLHHKQKVTQGQFLSRDLFLYVFIQHLHYKQNETQGQF